MPHVPSLLFKLKAHICVPKAALKPPDPLIPSFSQSALTKSLLSVGTVIQAAKPRSLGLPDLAGLFALKFHLQDQPLCVDSAWPTQDSLGPPSGVL